MYNFMKQNYIGVERGAIITDFWQKRRLKDPKNVKLIEKRQKVKKTRKMCQFWTWNAFSGSAKHCGINFRDLHFNIASTKNYFYKKPNYKQKLYHLDEKTAKNGYLYVPFSQKTTFQSPKVTH